MPASAGMCYDMWNADIDDDNDEDDDDETVVQVVAGVKRKRTCHSDIQVRCETHGVGDDKMAVGFKGGQCRQCTVVNCGKCGPKSLAYIGGNCIECLNDRVAKKNAANKAKNGAGTHTVEHACTLEKHADCTLQNVDNICFRCVKNGTSVRNAATRTRESRKELCPCEIKPRDVYAMEGTPCSVCTQPVVQLEKANEPLGLSLDRTDPIIGYTHANTTAMHAQCNYLKGERTVAETRATLLCIYATFKNGGIVFGALMNEQAKQAAARFTDDEASCRKGARDVFKHITSHKKGQAKADDTEFDITWKDTKALFEKQNGQCALCSIPCGSDMSFDQIVAGQGYINGNVQIVHLYCNMGKGRWPVSDLHATATALATSMATATATATATTTSA